MHEAHRASTLAITTTVAFPFTCTATITGPATATTTATATATATATGFVGYFFSPYTFRNAGEEAFTFANVVT